MNEFEFSASAAAPSPADALAVSAIPVDTPFAPEPSVAPNTPANTQCSAPCDVSVYIDSSSSSSGGDGLAVFDLVLNVSWTENNSYKSAKVIKTVAFDKNQLMIDALASKVTVVEGKPEKSNATLLKMRELAGIPGKGTFVN